MLYLIRFSIRSNFRCFWLFLPQDTRRKFNVHKTFRGHPECPLSILYTPNLRPVSSSFSRLHTFSLTSYLSSRFCNNNFCSFSVVGLNFDFLCYNILGYLAYSVYNVGLFYFKSIQVYFPIIPDNWHLLIPLKTSENLAYQVVRNVRFDRLIFLGRSWREYWEKKVNRPS